ncbi:MAG TPA: flagellar biosynthetic protein FliO [Bacillota bacterium]
MSVETVWMLLRVLIMSAAVAGLAYVAAALIRQRAVRLRRGAYLELIDALSLGGRNHLALIRAGTRVLCVGVSAEGLRPISEFDGEDARRLLAGAVETPGDAGPDTVSGGLGARFRGLLERRLHPEARGERE